jgi:Tol biopolymer transport system component
MNCPHQVPCDQPTTIGRPQPSPSWTRRLILLLPLTLALLLSAVPPAPASAQDEAAAADSTESETAAKPISFESQIAPILAKYCVGCHNAGDKEGSFAIDSYSGLRAGGDSGPAIVPGDAEASLMMQLVRGDVEPRMPPDDQEGPQGKELQLLTDWINAGAPGPADDSAGRPRLMTPQLPRALGADEQLTALARSPDGKQLALGRFGQVELLDAESREIQMTLTGIPGKVNAVSFAAEGKQLVVASGIAGVEGQASIWDLTTGEMSAQFTGHQDMLYDAQLSPDGKVLATCSYDQQILLWNVGTGEVQMTMAGHNGAVFALAFSPDGTVLASASADETVKLWRVVDGQRLDTLSQPEAEQYAVAFSPDGRHIVAGGADNRIRVWRFVSRETPRINPLRFARFGHEGSILKLAFSPDGTTLASAAEDHAVKLWETSRFTELHLYESLSSLVTGLTVDADNQTVHVAQLHGQLARMVGSTATSDDSTSVAVVQAIVRSEMPAELQEQTEQEPNDSPEQATPVQLPARIRGVIEPRQEGTVDVDLYRFEAKEGEQWILEVEAARNQSPLDSYLEVLDENGAPIERVLLQAVRDSYFTFRGKDSDTSDDFRIHNWEEMELNEYLYANGEVVKLWLYPRGPDSGFKVYPGSGKRWGYFDTTPVSHALGAPCFIVVPHPPGTSLIPNGLPVFPIYYENDDDSRRRFGADSRLTFTAPKDGSYLVRVSDVRGFGGEDYRYDLIIRPRRPDFKVTLEGANPQVNAGSSKEFTVRAERMDEYDGPIRVDIEEAPAGFHVTSPIVIEAGQISALGVISADPDAVAPSEEEAGQIQVTATATIDGEEVTHEVNSLGKIGLADAPKLLVRILPDSDNPGSVELSADSTSPKASDEPWELVIEPGTTVTAKVRVERQGHDGVISFGNEDSGRNLPHGVYVDNIGLNGLLLLETQDERTFFITAAKWVPESTRLFHLTARVDGNQSSLPVRIRVRSGRTASTQD